MFSVFAPLLGVRLGGTSVPATSRRLTAMLALSPWRGLFLWSCRIQPPAIPEARRSPPARAFFLKLGYAWRP
jgi:hypothetical protein